MNVDDRSMNNPLVSQSEASPTRLKKRRQTLLTVGRTSIAIAFAIQTVACSGSAAPPTPLRQPTTSTGSTAQQSVASAHVNPDSFSGPIVAHCRVGSGTTTISKLNLDTGELVTIAIFPNGCVGGDQLSTNYSADFRKQVSSVLRSDSHVLYYDSRTGTSVDVTNIVSPTPAGDFGMQTIPRHTYPQFDEQGLFVFFDINSGEYKFFDTDAKQIVRTSKTYYRPHLQQLALDPSRVKPDELPKDDNTRLCGLKWIINDTRYLRTTSDSQGNYRLLIAPIPQSVSARPNCNEAAGQVITPPSLAIFSAAADPAGSTIIFLVESRTNGKALNLYRVNSQDPSRPTQIKLSDSILDHAGVSEDRDQKQVVSFIGWR